MSIPEEYRDNYHITSNYPITTDAQRALQEDRNEHLAWIVITSFYQALHWVDAFLLTKEHEPNNHGERRSYIENTEDLEKIKESYWELKGASELARYEKDTFKDCDAEVEKLLEISHSIVKHIKVLMKIE